LQKCTRERGARNRGVHGDCDRLGRLSEYRRVSAGGFWILKIPRRVRAGD
jgi:hypothetical protein